MKEKKLSKRLLQVAAFVRPGAFLADVGTDHAYLPIYLMRLGVIKGAVAADIEEGPLAHARRHVENSGLSRQIRVLRSDGLENLSEQEIDDVVIAGMGGELIASILLRSGWKDPGKNFILQPMTQESHLRKLLWENGYEIDREQAVAEGRHVYTVLQVRYTGRMKKSRPLECAVGLIDKKLGDGERYLMREKKRADDKILRASHSGDEAGERYWRIAREKIEKLLEEQK